MATFAFVGGSTPVNAYGQKIKVRFVETWGSTETWTITFTSTLTGDFTLGKGNIAGRTPLSVFKLGNRVIVGLGSDFALSSIGNPLKWEEQDPGAAKISFVSQAGPQDTVQAFTSVQGRLVVIGAQTTQIWEMDSNPAQLQLVQTLESTGTIAPLSVASVGDLDAYYLDYTGIRSFRSKEFTLNASVNDIGTAVDTLVRAALVNNTDPICAVVEPTTKQYWLYLNSNFYVLSNYRESKITAWSTFKATTEETVSPTTANYSAIGENTYSSLTAGDLYYWTKGANDTSLLNGSTLLTASGSFTAASDFVDIKGTNLAAITSTLVHVNAAFIPNKMVVHNGQVYIRAQSGKIYYYGGSGGNTYDRCQMTVETPWHDLKMPSKRKQGQGFDMAFKGDWILQAGMNPLAGSLVTILDRGSAVSPSFIADSTYDVGHFNYSANGTHVKMKMISQFVAANVKLSKVTFQYSLANEK